jgi:hypothetical protein
VIPEISIEDLGIEGEAAIGPAINRGLERGWFRETRKPMFLHRGSGDAVLAQAIVCVAPCALNAALCPAQVVMLATPLSAC